jgi:hypothetical protein
VKPFFRKLFARARCHSGARFRSTSAALSKRWRGARRAGDESARRLFGGWADVAPRLHQATPSRGQLARPRDVGGTAGVHGDPTAWQNSEMSSQIIPLEGRTDLRRYSSAHQSGSRRLDVVIE